MAGPHFQIPEGTPNGRTFRVRGKGVRRSDGTVGDLLVTVDVQVPKHLEGKPLPELAHLLRVNTSGAAPKLEAKG